MLMLVANVVEELLGKGYSLLLVLSLGALAQRFSRDEVSNPPILAGFKLIDE